MTDVQNSPFDMIIKPLAVNLNSAGYCFMKSEFMKNKFWPFVTICNVFWAFLTCFCINNLNNFEDIVDFTTSFGALTQTSASIIAYHFYKKDINATIKIMKKNFWFNEDKLDTKIIIKYKVIYNIFYKIIKYYEYACRFTIILWGFYPTNIYYKKFMLSICVPYYNFIKETPYYEITYILQTFTISLGAILVFYEDMTYAAFTSFALIQVDLIKYKLTSIITSNASEAHIYKELKECIIHHNLILQFLNKTDEIFKHIILTKLISNVLICTTCFKLALTRQGINFKFFIAACIAVFEPLIYCFFGDLVTSECESIGDAAYEVNWEDVPFKSVRTSLCMIIARSQKRVFMKAGGLITLSLNNYVAFVKMIFSFYVLFDEQEI